MICRSSSGRMNVPHMLGGGNEVDVPCKLLVLLAARMHLQTRTDTWYVTGDQTSHHNHARKHTRITCIHVPVHVHMCLNQYPRGCHWFQTPIAT